MKVTTQRKTKKNLKFYITNYGFRKPYQVLLDGTVCQAALKNKVNIKDQFPKYLDGDAKLLTTQCVIIELEKLGGYLKGALIIIKQFGYHKCGHEKGPVSASECLKSMIGEKNENRYILATQDKKLQQVARRIPGTPIIYLHGRTPVFENPSDMSTRVAHDVGQAKFLPAPLPGAAELQPQPERKKRKKKGGPNSLSCKKKKKATPATVKKSKIKSEQGENDKVKRKRKRIKLAKHLKEVKREWLGQAPGTSSN